ncbi:MAG: hypothetical protein IPJ65_21830 [Archangiaceae bacterium]|nr:hypothetical protein [Archangiaceae bacterium]
MKRLAVVVSMVSASLGFVAGDRARPPRPLGTLDVTLRRPDDVDTLLSGERGHARSEQRGCRRSGYPIEVIRGSSR